MKTKNILSIITLALVLLFSACQKDKETKDIELGLKDVESDLFIRGDGQYAKVIINPLVKLDDCKYIVAGTIEFHKGDQIIATIDFGDGSCDNIATKIVGDQIFTINLDRLGDGKDDYTKVIVEPLVKIDDCDYIVAGIIKFYKGDSWIATIDYGDGSCDNLAMKYWDGGQKEIILK